MQLLNAMISLLPSTGFTRGHDARQGLRDLTDMFDGPA
jgi:hypothetical protein